MVPAAIASKEAAAAAITPSQDIDFHRRIVANSIEKANDNPHAFRAKKSKRSLTYWCDDDSSVAIEGGNTSDTASNDTSDFIDFDDDQKMPAVNESPQDLPPRLEHGSKPKASPKSAPPCNSVKEDSRKRRRASATKSRGDSDVFVGANVWVRPEHCRSDEDRFLQFAKIVEITGVDDEEGIAVEYSPSQIIEFVSIDRIKTKLGKRRRQPKIPDTSSPRKISTSTPPSPSENQIKEERNTHRNRKSRRFCSRAGCTNLSKGKRCNFMCIRHHKESIADVVKTNRCTRSTVAPSRRGNTAVIDTTAVGLASTPAAKQRRSFLARLHHAIEYSSLDQVKSIFNSARTRLSENITGEDVLIATRGLVRDTFWRDGGNKDSFGFNLLHAWAYYRYNDPETKPFLRNAAADQDAAECLEFLLSEGADICSKSSDFQTVLHIAMSLGYDNVIRALLTRYEVSLNDLMPLDRFGDTPLHGAISSGCIETFATMLEISKASDENVLDWIENLKDANGNSLLIQLIRFTDINYDLRPKACRASVNRSETFQLLDSLLKLVTKHERYDLLLDYNDAGDNIACIAGKMGQIYEARVVLDICVPLTKKAIANRCGELRGENGAVSHVSPLQWATETRDALAESIGASRRRKKQLKEKLSSRGISALDHFFDYKDDSRLENWLDSAEKTVELLQRVSKNEAVGIKFVAKIRPGTVITEHQVISEEAEALKQKLGLHHQRRDIERVTCVQSVDYWKSRINKNTAKTRNQIESILDGGNNAVRKYTEIRVIRDPMNPCVINSGPCDVQVGLFAKMTIPAGTIICEVS